jgi:hypothetical protein
MAAASPVKQQMRCQTEVELGSVTEKAGRRLASRPRPARRRLGLAPVVRREQRLPVPQRVARQAEPPQRVAAEQRAQRAALRGDLGRAG